MAPPIVFHTEKGLTELSHRYVIVPAPVLFVVLVNAAGSPPLHIVWAVPIAPAVGTDCTVTWIVDVATDSQAILFNVDTVIRLYCVVAVNPEGASYVADVAPPIVFHTVKGLTELSQRYVSVPAPVPFVVLVNTAGSPPLHIVWAVPVAPAVATDCTVTWIVDVATDVQAILFNVDMVTLLYCVVAVNPKGAS